MFYGEKICLRQDNGYYPATLCSATDRGGGYLVSLSGSWYYLIAGLLLLISSLLLFKGKRTGLAIFFVLYIATFFWTLYESGSDYWGWIPRMSVLTVLALLLSLTIPALNQGRKKASAVRWQAFLSPYSSWRLVWPLCLITASVRIARLQRLR